MNADTKALMGRIQAFADHAMARQGSLIFCAGRTLPPVELSWLLALARRVPELEEAHRKIIEETKYVENNYARAANKIARAALSPSDQTNSSGVPTGSQTEHSSGGLESAEPERRPAGAPAIPPQPKGAAVSDMPEGAWPDDAAVQGGAAELKQALLAAEINIPDWRLPGLARVVLIAAAVPSPSRPEGPDMRAVVEALGFEPDNHHNALKCPYCNPEGLTFAPSQITDADVERCAKAGYLAYWADMPPADDWEAADEQTKLDCRVTTRAALQAFVNGGEDE